MNNATPEVFEDVGDPDRPAKSLLIQAAVKWTETHPPNDVSRLLFMEAAEFAWHGTMMSWGDGEDEPA